jgi:hypothetical protein
MLTEKEIKDLAVEYAWDHFPTYPTELGDIQDAYTQGYQVCQETIPSECIGFAEWIDDNQILRVNHKDGISWYSQRMDKFLCNTSTELYSIYLESLKNK